MFVQIFFLPYLKKNKINYWISITLAGYPAGYPVSGRTGYPTVQSGIRPDPGYKKAGLSGRISGIRPLPDIRPHIRYPAFGLAGYPAKTLSGASLYNVLSILVKDFFESYTNIPVPVVWVPS
jgi:hypothetical protein